ncbi:MAG: PepSY domain-containing protein [Methylacidiphilales bacterium]|nr:PepSY domain-containing protein [Candidatus Methylacidiphilales bacterium]
MIRGYLLWLHRWAGLLMAGFLVIEGVTGSLLAFNQEIQEWLTPQLFVSPPPGAKPLDLATLAERTEALVPHARPAYMTVGNRRVDVRLTPRLDPATGKPYDVHVEQLVLNPWTGEELGRSLSCNCVGGQDNFMAFIYNLHVSLALGNGGALVLGIVALVWTVDCFVGFYLTLPASVTGFFNRWRHAWIVKWRAAPIRVNFDLHRATGLWLWPLLFIFAWSSVMFNLSPVYEKVTGTLFAYQSPEDEGTSIPKHWNDSPRLDWHQAQTIGGRLTSELAARRGFTVTRSIGIGYQPEYGAYLYGVQSSLDVEGRPGWQGPGVWLDGDTGKPIQIFVPTGEHAGNTISAWLRGLHFADVHDNLAYRIFVGVLGIAIVILSVTGIYIWWRKRPAKRQLITT